MKEVSEALPGARRALFARYHIGGCSSCGFQPEETLGAVCARNENLPVEDVIAHLKASHEHDQNLLLSPEELANLLAEAADEEIPLMLVDLRTREEHEAVAIPGSQLFSQDLQQEAFQRWDKNGLIVLYDHQGTRALDVAAYFVGHGFSEVKALQGGIDRYSLEVDPSLPRYEVEIE